MKLEMRGMMRLEQKMKLAPHMIQSMEILQLPILALQERIEQELNSNPVLEINEPSDPEETEAAEQQAQRDKGAETTVQGEGDSEPVEDFERINNLDDYYKDYMERSSATSIRRRSDEPDKKLEAIKNTVAGPQSLHEYLEDQWRLVEGEEAVKAAGNVIIDYIDDRGYLSVRLEQLHNKDRAEFTFDDLKKALELVQQLEPSGMGARDLKECLLIQMSQQTKDTSFEARLLSEYMDDLLANHLPGIAKKMVCSIEEVKEAIERISKLDTSPGLQIGQQRNYAIAADVIIEASDEQGNYSVRLADSGLPSLRINDYYSDMSKTAGTNEKTKKFLQDNVRSAQWIIDAIEQRKNTLLRVTRAVVKRQTEFFDKGKLYLKPLPMSKIADDIGVHMATVSRAVAGKYVQCYWGVLPLRKFFSGGTEDASGNAHSWEAIRGKLQHIVDEEDKSKPLNDGQIRKKLAEAGIEKLARRTVAKYRKALNIPAARYRKKY